MTTAQPEVKNVIRTCKIVLLDGRVCGRTYSIPEGSHSVGCPHCAPRLYDE